MRKIFSILLGLCMFPGLTGCSIEVNQPTPAVAVSPNIVATLPPDAGAVSTSAPSGSRPVTWANLNLTGRLVYIRLSSSDDIPELNIETLDLTTGDIRKVFTAPEDAWIYYSAVSPDGKELVISYTPPSAASASRNQMLYRLPMDGSAGPELVITPPGESDQYIQAEWSPDGKHLYYVHNNFSTLPADQVFPNYEIVRMAYPDGEPEKIIDHAFWPRISPDSSKMVYVSLDPVSGVNELFLANADGTNAQVVSTGSLQETGIIDAPFITPDGQSIIFSAPDPAQAYQPNWLDRLMGVQIAKAHGAPADWWIVPITGGEPARLTQIQAINLFARMSPDGRHLVSYSLNGLFVMGLDGSNLTSITPDPSGSTVDWLP